MSDYLQNSSFPVIKKYELNEFKPLVNSIRTGDLRTFNDGLVKYQDLFIRYVKRQCFSVSPHVTMTHSIELVEEFIFFSKSAKQYAIETSSSVFIL
jgi:hypothetical protein